MKAVVINGSPHAEKGNTAIVLRPFIEGLEEAGAAVAVYYTSRMEIKPCRGEYACWFRSPGRCFQDDDMMAVVEEVSNAEILVLATPVYVDGMTGPMKNLLDRVIPIGDPLIELREGHCRHPGRVRVEGARIALVSNCGFWEMDNFDPLVAHVRAIGINLGREFAGALLRPHGAFLRSMIKRGVPVNDILDAARKAGNELVSRGFISEESIKTVGRELLPLDQYIEIANHNVSEALEALYDRE